MVGIVNASSNCSIGQAQSLDPLHQAMESIYSLFQKTVLTEKDAKKLIGLIPYLAGKIHQSPMEEIGSASYFLMISTILKAKDIFIKHSEIFSQADKDTMQSIFSKNLIINGQNVSVDPYQWASSLKELSVLFIGNLESGPITLNHFEEIRAYRENKTLPENIEQLFALFKEADANGYKELEEAVCKKILSIDNPVKEKLWESVKDKLLEYALNSGNSQLVAECLPHVVKGKNSKEIAEIICRLNGTFPKEWRFKIKDWFFTITDDWTRGRLLQVQYKTKMISLEDLTRTLNFMLMHKARLHVEKEAIESSDIKEDGKDALCVYLSYGPQLHELFKLLLQIKVIVKIVFYVERDETIEDFKDSTFPQVKKVQVYGTYREPVSQKDRDLNDQFKQLCPNAQLGWAAQSYVV